MTEIETQENQGLTPKQEKFVDAMLTGANIGVAARTCGIAASTAQRWQKLPAVRAAYKAARQELFDEKLSAIRDGVGIAIRTLLRNMGEDAKPYVQVAAASKWLDVAIELYKHDMLEERLQELEAIVDERYGSNHR